ncbi:MAG TPA: hypothetical protein VEH84_07100 [Alphaproteobacteria bacterium]|nr:hypothetical protein [Alphaproteobacteria bacterium]
MSKIKTIIAQSIKDADRSWFNENYNAQADSVVNALRKAGYEVVPQQPSDRMVEETIENLPFGRMRPPDLVRELYRLMLAMARKYPD